MTTFSKISQSFCACRVYVCICVFFCMCFASQRGHRGSHLTEIIQNLSKEKRWEISHGFRNEARLLPYPLLSNSKTTKGQSFTAGGVWLSQYGLFSLQYSSSHLSSQWACFVFWLVFRSTVVQNYTICRPDLSDTKVCFSHVSGPLKWTQFQWCKIKVCPGM